MVKGQKKCMPRPRSYQNMVIRPRKGMKNIPTKCKSMCSSMSWISKCLKLKALNLQHTKKDAVGGGGGG